MRFHWLNKFSGLLFFAGLLFTASGVWGQATDSIVVPADRIFSGTFANDASFRTDYYYTQGITAAVILPVLQRWPLIKLLPQPKQYPTRHYGLKIWYEGFTPLKILDPNIRYGDRPYAAYIYSTHFTVATNAAKKQRFTSGLDLGFIGPEAGAKGFQTKFHEFLGDPLPQGWDYQIQTDLVLGYRANLEKQLLGAGRVVEVIGNAGTSLGTLYTYATGGLLLRTGKMNGYFQNLGLASRTNRANLQKFQFYGQARLDGRLVGHNATLQGGFLNKQNPYTLPDNLMKRGVRQSSAGLLASYGGVSFESSVIWLSREIKDGRPHQWMYFDLRFVF